LKGGFERRTSGETEFEPLNQRFVGRRFHGNEGVEIAIREWLRLQSPDFYGDGIFELEPSWDK
jgi:hypothetical protein